MNVPNQKEGEEAARRVDREPRLLYLAFGALAREMSAKADLENVKILKQ